jgi:hypothetical protein
MQTENELLWAKKRAVHSARPPRWPYTAQSRRDDLPTRVQRLVQYRLNADRIRYRVEREFPLVNAKPAQRRAFREYLARLIVRYRHGTREPAG